MEIHESCHEKCDTSNPEPTREEEDDDADGEDEALSLCDLPLDSQTRHRDDQSPAACSRIEEDFDFGSWGRSVPREPEMCSADDVFFKGQILPLRSVSSDAGWPGSGPEFIRSISRSESMDHASISRLTSVNTSRSSSTRSYNSSTSCSSAAANSNPTRIRNNFHAHPSPKPQIRTSRTWPGSGNPNPRTQKSTLWDFLKLGLIRAPEIELQDLKARNSFSTSNNNNRISVSRNSSCSSNSSGSIKNHHHQEPKQGSFVQVKRSTMGLFGGGCKCSADAIQSVVLNDAVLVKSCRRNGNRDDVEEKVVMIKKDDQEKGKEKETMKRRGKQALSRRRTTDWLRELSHVTYGADD